MYLKDESIVFSPSDLVLFVSSPFASWMDHLALVHPDLAPDPDEEDSLFAALKHEGLEHELGKLLQFEEASLSIVRLVETNFIKDTINAMESGADVIYQPPLEALPFRGRADFLIKKEGQSRFGNYFYEIWDTKLARSVKTSFIMQLCCYAEMLEQIQGRRPDNFVVSIGTGEDYRLRTTDYFDYYLIQKKRFLQFHAEFDVNKKPDLLTSYNYGKWSNYAKELQKESDHLTLIANIKRTQIKKLYKNGITTTKDLTASEKKEIRGISQDVIQKLIAQAKIQNASKGKEVPQYEILPHEEGSKIGLALLPPFSPNDVFFDIEGDPLFEGGLEYLWGVTYFDDKRIRQYKDFWAHHSEDEKKCCEAFIHWVYQRWLDDPSMHIYHYGPYEVSVCRRLMGRYGICEYEVDQLLRNEVFVDLYKIVKTALLIGEPRYSIKNVEHLYRRQRDTTVTSGGDSVAVYEQWRENPDGHDWKTSQILKAIRDYNIDDCNSTQELVQWLRERQKEAGISYLGKTEILEPEEKEETNEVIALRDRLLKKSEDLYFRKEIEEAAISRLFAWCLEFHRREIKPTFWKIFDRLDKSEEELFDDIDCLAFCKRTTTAPYLPSKRSRLYVFEYAFDPNQEFKGKADSYRVLGKETEDGKSLKVTLYKEGSNLKEGLIALKMKEEISEPITLIPDDFVNPDPIPQAIYKQALKFEKDELNKCAIYDFLKRDFPRVRNINPGDVIAPSHNPKKRLEEIIQVVKNLDHSYLPIQGPPGSGKTYTAKHIIAELVRLGKKVGITSNSHKAINHLLCCTVEYCLKEGIKGYFACASNNDKKIQALSIEIIENKEIIEHIQPACVIGTTAWGFSRNELEEAFDYLFVDEAGQVSVANLIAMSQSTKNIIIMGDQMQLAQPCQGSHPEESGCSILDYLLHHTPTIPENRGIFLGTTYRMHSKINEFISEAIYESKLESASENDKRFIKMPANYQGILNIEAGIITVPVEHDGNLQASDEEVEEIHFLTHELINREYIDNNEKKLITWEDMLFVAPYNHQVNKLQQALGQQAKVGSVDKFQGQEAPIVFLSMCASDANESPRGINFLFDKNRINVAISRAKCLAIVVYSPSLLEAEAKNIEQMEMINLFCKLISTPKRLN
ncbi:TM0106 family RecB-like putative nuclease [Legionella septentrionalis]|uniref:TM0106 family RecB-like putative nuclease n=1 Tax=Legionella septentrionalis TaxID=2498109 RepID=A0A433JIH5_9GAMM|nr:TM0106 family RecB-like putative nuclease [Legionella septentrionalis]RUQ85119.1 TM0106 family RecB-like putative nuclease [Legionella septentrionalis]